MSAIPSTTSGSLASLLAQLASQNQTPSSLAAPAAAPDDLFGEEADSEADSPAGAVPQSNIFATIAALGPFSNVTQQGGGTQDTLAAFLGDLEQNDTTAPGATASTDIAANSTASLSDEVSAIAAGNDTTSRQAAFSQLLSSDGLSSSELQMNFLTATLESTSAGNPDSAAGGIFQELSQDSSAASALNTLG